VNTPDLPFQFKDLVRRRLQSALYDVHAEEHAPELVELITHYLERPARFIRPRLVVAAARAYGARDFREDSPVVLLSVATELLHVFALLHDDRIDAPCHDGAYSSGTSVLAGDLLFAAGYGLIAETVERYRLSQDILAVVGSVASRTVVGQSVDVRFRRIHGDRPSTSDLYRLYDLKTGLYTVAAPLQIGALAADCDPTEVAGLEAVAIPLGRAFQMQDDLDDLADAQNRINGSDGAPTTPGGSFPPWELNLAVTYTAEQARRRAVSQEEIHDDRAFLHSLDMGELKRFVAAEIEGMVGEARHKLDQLSLSSRQRHDFRREIEAALANLTFPSHEANTVSRTYGGH
jgi:geranylgeranyl pyrophosphate synthase